MQTNAELDSFFSVETIQPTHDIVFFKEDYFFAEHCQSKGGGKTGQSGSNDDYAVVFA